MATRTQTTRKPITVYRLWCGRKRYTGWIGDRAEIFRIALRHGLAYGDEHQTGLGPLTWIEIGERKYARSRTIPITR